MAYKKYPVVSFKPSLKTNPHATYKNSSKTPLQNTDLNNYFIPIQNQQQIGACTAFGSLEWRLALMAQAGIKNLFIPAFLANYYEERKDDGDINTDGGSTITEAVNVLETYGAMPATDDPYSDADFAVNPPNDWDPRYKLKSVNAQQLNSETLLADTLDALSNGHPVLFGTTVYEGLESPTCAQTGILPMPSAGENIMGGHCMVLVGHDQSREMVCARNSWGPDWGDKGCVWIPYAYFEQYAYDCWAGFPDFEATNYYVTVNGLTKEQADAVATEMVAKGYGVEEGQK